MAYKEILTEQQYRKPEGLRKQLSAAMEPKHSGTAGKRILDELSKELRDELRTARTEENRIVRRLEVIEALRLSGNRRVDDSEVIPLSAGICAHLQLDGGRFATST